MSADVAPTAASAGATPAAPPAARRVRVLGTLLVALGLLMGVAGIGTWAAIAQGLAQEEITVSEDAAAFVGQPVVTPWTVWAQAEVIRADLDEMTGGRTYAEMEREDPLRPAVATGTFLRASLITSVVAFGVALALVGVGTGFVLGGLGLRSTAAR